jgi:hypothetical protein
MTMGPDDKERDAYEDGYDDGKSGEPSDKEYSDDPNEQDSYYSGYENGCDDNEDHDNDCECDHCEDARDYKADRDHYEGKGWEENED